MPGQATCPKCGVPLTGPRGHCPRCLLRAGLDGESLSVGATGAVSVTMALADESPSSVLADLIATVGPVPRVLLRDADSGVEPPARPGSDAMPRATDRGGPLQILGEIARGGMGAVLKGRDADLGRDLAVKVLLEQHRDQPEMLRRFVEEAQIAGQLQHPGIVPIYQLGAFADRRPYFTMKLVKGRTLAEILRDRPGPSHDRPRLLAVFLQVAQAVAYAHARGVIHRDLKPSNVMVGSFGEVQVMDWGLAKVLPRGGAVDDATAGRKDASETIIATARTGGDDSELSRVGSVLGTPAYMAPEQARGEIDRLDERCDVFALGSILCEVLTGEPAFTGRSSGEIQRKAARGESADARARLDSSDADPELLALATDCLAAETDDRPRDAGVVAARLSAHLAGVQDRLRAADLASAAEQARSEEARRTAAAALAQARAERRARRLTLALAASIVSLFVLGAGGFGWSQRQRANQAARTAAAVDDALADAERAAGAARAEAAGAEARWSEAVALAQNADELARRADADAATRRRAAAVLERLGRECDAAAVHAHQAEADRRLLARLVTARITTYDDQSGVMVGAYYGDAFREAGLDPDSHPAAAGAALAARPPAVAQAAAAALHNWASLQLIWGGDAAGAARLTEAARGADPDPWRCHLRDAMLLPEQPDRLARLRRLADDARPEEVGPISSELLSRALYEAGDPPAAERILVAAHRRFPGDPWINLSLGKLRYGLARYGDALPYFTAARAVYPESAHWLAHCYNELGNDDEAEAVFRDVLRLQPDDPVHPLCMGRFLRAAGRSREADEVFDTAAVHIRETIQRQPDRKFRLNELAIILWTRGKTAEADSVSHEAVRNFPSSLLAHLSRAVVLLDQRRYRELEAEAREMVQIRRDSFTAHGWLGSALRYQGKLDEALAAYRRAHEVLHRPGTWYDAELTALTRRSERQLAQARRLPAILRGDDHPKDAAEAIDLANLCMDRGFPAAAVKWFAIALAIDPAQAEVRDDPPTVGFVRPPINCTEPIRLQAARAAVLAGTGRGQDAPPPESPERARLRGQALASMRQELAAWAHELKRGDITSGRRVRNALANWQEDAVFRPAREPDALDALPEAERADWKAFWHEAQALLQLAGKVLR